MRFSTILGSLVGTVIAMPVADPRPEPTAAANPAPAPVAAPQPTAMPEPQFGLGVTTPFGDFNLGSRPQNQQGPPPYYNNGGYGRPVPTTTCGGFAAYCIYSSVSKGVSASIYTSIQDGVLDAFGLGSKASQTTIVYVPTPGPGQYAPGGYQNGGNSWNQPAQYGGNNPYQNIPGYTPIPQQGGWKE